MVANTGWPALNYGVRLLLLGLWLMLLVRSGVLASRVVGEWGQPVAIWQPANQAEQLIWDNYLQVGQ